MYATLAAPLAIIGAGGLVGFYSYYKLYTLLRFGIVSGMAYFSASFLQPLRPAQS
jgi:uncharacterized membrane protein (UPF0136 family)